MVANDLAKHTPRFQPFIINPYAMGQKKEKTDVLLGKLAQRMGFCQDYGK